MEELAQFLGYFLVAIVTGYISYRQSTRKGAARSRASEQETERLTRENVQLSRQIADNEIITRDMRQQLSTLSHFQMLYETLKEAHDGLKLDHEELKAKFEDKSQAWNVLKSDRDTKDIELAETKKQTAELFEANKTLVARCGAFERAFVLLGQKLTEPEPSEAKQPEPEVSETKSEEKVGNDGETILQI